RSGASYSAGRSYYEGKLLQSLHTVGTGFATGMIPVLNILCRRNKGQKRAPGLVQHRNGELWIADIECTVGGSSPIHRCRAKDVRHLDRNHWCRLIGCHYFRRTFLIENKL